MKRAKQGSSSNSNPSIKTKAGKTVSIPYEGSLGLLALGDVGLVLWREAKGKYKPKVTT